MTVAWVNDKILEQNLQELMNSDGRQHKSALFLFFIKHLPSSFSHIQKGCHEAWAR